MNGSRFLFWRLVVFISMSNLYWFIFTIFSNHFRNFSWLCLPTLVPVSYNNRFYFECCLYFLNLQAGHTFYLEVTTALLLLQLICNQFNKKCLFLHKSFTYCIFSDNCFFSDNIINRGKCIQADTCFFQIVNLKELLFVLMNRSGIYYQRLYISVFLPSHL